MAELHMATACHFIRLAKDTRDHENILPYGSTTILEKNTAVSFKKFIRKIPFFYILTAEIKNILGELSIVFPK